MKFSGNVNNGTKNRRLDFSGDPDHSANTGTFKKVFFIIVCISHIECVGP